MSTQDIESISQWKKKRFAIFFFSVRDEHCMSALVEGIHKKNIIDWEKSLLSHWIKVIYIYIYMHCTHTHTHTHIYIYIYIYMSSESARDNFGKFTYQLQPKTKTLVRKSERLLIKLYRQNLSLLFNQTR